MNDKAIKERIAQSVKQCVDGELILDEFKIATYVFEEFKREFEILDLMISDVLKEKPQ